MSAPCYSPVPGPETVTDMDQWATRSRDRNLSGGSEGRPRAQLDLGLQFLQMCVDVAGCRQGLDISMFDRLLSMGMEAHH